MLTIGLILYLLLVVGGAALFFGRKNVWGIIAPMIALGFMAVASLTAKPVLIFVGVSIGCKLLWWQMAGKQ
jgi:hypothetical protein